MNNKKIYDLLEAKYIEFDHNSFISSDPVSVPHKFTKKEDIEIAAFFAATFAWGQRVTAIRNANKIMNLMDVAPYDFIINHTNKDLKRFDKFVHRTFSSKDCITFISCLSNIYHNHKGIEGVFNKGIKTSNDVKDAIIHFHNTFFELNDTSKSKRHLSNPLKNSAAKRINLFLRWMVRKDKHGVDFGIWKTIKPSQLYCPLDVHSGNISRQLGILTRTQNDWKAVVELTEELRKYDPVDPVKYDFALFGVGVNSKSNSSHNGH